MSASLKRKQRQDGYRAAIIAAAELVFAEHGFEGARIQGIAQEAGLAVGTIYGVFDGKAELFSEVLTHRLPEIMERAREATLGAESTLDALRRGQDAYIRYMLEHPHWLRIHLREHPWGLGPSRGVPGQLDAWKTGLDFQGQVLAQAMKDGDVVETEPVLLARSMAAIQQIHLQRWVDDGMHESPDEVRERLKQLFELFFCTPGSDA